LRNSDKKVKHLSEVDVPALGVGLGGSGDGGLGDGGEEVAGLGGEAERDGDEAAIAQPSGSGNSVLHALRQTQH